MWVQVELSEATHRGWLLRALFFDDSNPPRPLTGKDWYRDFTQDTGGRAIGMAWDQKAGSVTTPAGAAKMKVAVYSYMANGWIAFDDVEVLKEVKGGVFDRIPVPNAGFEEGPWAHKSPRSVWPATSIQRGHTLSISNQATGSITTPLLRGVYPPSAYTVGLWLRGERGAQSRGNINISAQWYDFTGTQLLHSEQLTRRPSINPSWTHAGQVFCFHASTGC